MTDESRVALILDQNFGERGLLLAQTSHVWMIESPRNREAAEKVWRFDQNARFEASSGVSTFAMPYPLASIATNLPAILEMILDHHEHIVELAIHAATLGPDEIGAVKKAGFTLQPGVDAGVWRFSES